jgi:hypothetical protein
MVCVSIERHKSECDRREQEPKRHGCRWEVQEEDRERDAIESCVKEEEYPGHRDGELGDMTRDERDSDEF